MRRYEGDVPYAARSEVRYRAALRWLAPGAITAEHLRSALSDHEGAPDSICRHPEDGAQSKTIFWCIADVTEGKLMYGRGNPCNSHRADASRMPDGPLPLRAADLARGGGARRGRPGLRDPGRDARGSRLPPADRHRRGDRRGAGRSRRGPAGRLGAAAADGHARLHAAPHGFPGIDHDRLEAVRRVPARYRQEPDPPRLPPVPVRQRPRLERAAGRDGGAAADARAARRGGRAPSGTCRRPSRPSCWPARATPTARAAWPTPASSRPRSTWRSDPELVQMDKAVREIPDWDSEHVWMDWSDGPLSIKGQWSGWTESGVIGDATVGDRREGQDLARAGRERDLRPHRRSRPARTAAGTRPS